MTGEQWVKAVYRMREGLEALAAKFDEAVNQSDPEREAFLWANQYTTWHKLLNRMGELTRSFDTISPTDKWYIKAVDSKRVYLDDEWYQYVLSRVNVTNNAYRYLKRKDARILPNFGKYFLDVVQERGEQIEKITDLSLDKIKQFLPWILAGGAILIVLNVVSLVPKK